MKNIPFYLFFILFLTVNHLNAQWLLPPYKAEFSLFKWHGKNFQYWKEADLDGDGIDEMLHLAQGSKNSRPQLVLYEKGKLVDAFNGGEIYDFFHDDFVLRTKQKDYYIFAHYSEHHIALKMLTAEKGSFFVKSLYKIWVGSKYPRGVMIYLNIPQQNRLVVFINTNFPTEKMFRHIIMFDTKDFRLLWDKITPDFCYDFFTSNQDSTTIYYSTIAYSNQLYRANKTFYLKPNKDNIFLIDTSLISNPKTIPDTNASDYATDTCSYIVKLSISNGEELKRIKTGNSFYQTRFMSKRVDSIQYFNIFDRANGKSVFYGFDTRNDSLFRIKLNLPMNSIKQITLPRITFIDEKYLLYDEGSYFTVNKIKNNRLVEIKRVSYNLENMGRKLNNKYFVFHQFLTGNLYILDTNFNVVTFLKKEQMPKQPYRLIWSKNKNKPVISLKNGEAIVINFVKRPFYQRISPLFVKILLIGSIVLILAFAFLWLITMKISYKRLARKNQELADKSKELQLATAKLIRSEKLTLLGTVAASFAHQLNSPLGAILNSSERLEKEINNKNVDLIKRSVEYSKSLVQKFLETSRYDLKKELGCCNFTQVWNDWLLLFKDEALKRQIEIKEDFKHSNDKIKLKKSELFEIITNLVFNARDAILTADKEEKCIKISTSNDNETFELKFEDSGTGFNTEILSKIFEPFFTTKEQNKGTGLGLWVIKRILENYDGQIKVENTEKGALITIVLPLCKNEELRMKN